MIANMPLLKLQDQQLDYDGLCRAFEQVGLRPGDEICVHSSLFHLGTLMAKPQDFLAGMVAALRESIGPEGTLIMPTFTYSYCNSEIYDMRNSRSHMGILTEYYRKLPECIRTRDPLFSFAISGHSTAAYLQNDVTSCFGKDSVYDVLNRRGGKIVVLGDRANGYTFGHYVEECMMVSYRFFKTFSGTTITEDGTELQNSIDYFVRKLDGRSILSGAKVLDYLKQRHLATEIKLMGGDLCMFPCAPAKEALEKGMQEDELQFLF